MSRWGGRDGHDVQGSPGQPSRIEHMFYSVRILGTRALPVNPVRSWTPAGHDAPSPIPAARDAQGGHTRRLCLARFFPSTAASGASIFGMRVSNGCRGIVTPMAQLVALTCPVCDALATVDPKAARTLMVGLLNQHERHVPKVIHSGGSTRTPRRRGFAVAGPSSRSWRRSPPWWWSCSSRRPRPKGNRCRPGSRC